MSKWIWKWKLEGFQGLRSIYNQAGFIYIYLYIYIDISQVGVFLLDFDKTIYILILCLAGFCFFQWFNWLPVSSSKLGWWKLPQMQTCHQTCKQTITPQQTLIVYYIIRYILHIILYIYQIPICSTVMTKMEVSKATNIPHKQTNK